MIITATYSPEDNKLRLTASARLPADLYARVKAAGFRWAPVQGVFFAPAWTPDREDLCLELAGEIDDEDTSLIDRAEERAERFDDYRANRLADAESAHAAVKTLADGIPLGQPILVGHHSEKRARKDAERIENGMRQAVTMWRRAEYWTSRAAGAIRHAKYKERPDVRTRRIKTLEADRRKVERTRAHSARAIELWAKVLALPTELQKAGALKVANTHGAYSTWWDLSDGKITVEQAAEKNTEIARKQADYAGRWVEHYDNRIAYERAMLGEAAGERAEICRGDRRPEVGGGVICWAGPRGGWAYVQKVNRVTVSVLDNWGNGGRNFSRTIEFDKLHGIMSRAEVDAAREAGRLVESADKTGFFLVDATPPEPPAPAPPAEDTVCPDGPSCPDPACIAERGRRGISSVDIDGMIAALDAGIQVAAVHQLFPTPRGLAAQLVTHADVRRVHRTLEPSAGTGAILDALPALEAITAVEINANLCTSLRAKFDERIVSIVCADFLEQTPDALGLFDRIVMNPPFEKGADIRHIQHARAFLKPGGRLVSVCAAGPRQRAAFAGEVWIDLGPGMFAEQGTNVHTAIVIIDAPDPVRAVAEEIAQAEASAPPLADVPFALAPQAARGGSVQGGLF